MRESGFYWLWTMDVWTVAFWGPGLPLIGKESPFIWEFTNGRQERTYPSEWIGPRIEPPKEPPPFQL